MNDGAQDHPDGRREKPPLFSSWTRLYAAVLLNLVLLIILFTVITKVFD
ncbi:MAG: hypothetical protein ACYDH0_02735 [Candidatus Aminicenantales bacterium]